MNKSGTEESGTELLQAGRIVSSHRSSSALAQSSPRRRFKVRSWFPALLCAGIFLVCVLLVRPVLDTGIFDGWSYARTAQLLAQTGHIHYNGWAQAVVGWPLYVAALFIKIFGFSFLVIRATVVIEALAGIVLLQRTFVLAGISEWNSSLGTLTVALSPIFISYAVSFMTDIPGLLAIVVCLYACLRALGASEPRAAAGWIVFAALSNALLGTSRQIAWLGVLVMVPCALWLLRRKRVAAVAGAIACLTGIVFVFAALHWYNRQPYSVAEPLIRGRFSLAAGGVLVKVLLEAALDLVLFLLPVVVGFAPSLRKMGRRASIAAGSFAGVWMVFLAVAHLQGQLKEWLSPFLLFKQVHPQSFENTFATVIPIHGPAPFPLSHAFRLGLTLASLIGATILVGVFFERSTRRANVEDRTPVISWRDLLVLVVPFMLAYVALLMPRGVFLFIFDRYLLLLMPPALLLLLRLYQSRSGPRLPAGCIVLLVLMGGYSVTTTHDVFAEYRACLAAIGELRAAGVPRTAIDGGWEYDYSTQALVSGFVYQMGTRLPGGGVLSHFPHTLPPGPYPGCSMFAPETTPDVHALYGVAYPTSPCPRVADFPPIHFRTWLPPFRREADVVRYASGTR